MSAASLPVHQKAVDVDAGGIPKTIQLNCPLEPGELGDFIRLCDKTTKMPLALPDDGLILTEKLARILGLKAGDNLRVRVGEGRYASLPVTALTENYAEHYLYISPAAYTLLFGEEAAISGIYGNLAPGTDKEAFATELLSHGGMMNIRFMNDIRVYFSEQVDVMSYIVAVLLLSAAILAFVVLYSLSDINIEERRREIATIKVLGFFEREVARYINRETLLLSVFGSVLGLFFGVWLLRFVIANAEVETLVFSREISLLNYLWSFLITMGFAMIINWMMGFRIRRVEMVESLKSVE
jgi:putative ABC transport system permease protein